MAITKVKLFTLHTQVGYITFSTVGPFGHMTNRLCQCNCSFALPEDKRAHKYGQKVAHVSNLLTKGVAYHYYNVNICGDNRRSWHAQTADITGEGRVGNDLVNTRCE